jgi:tRNA threonylcarbamoyladenosine biosynthesis protein TsaB
VGLPAEVRLVATAGGGEWYAAGNGFAAYPGLAAELALSHVAADARPTAQSIGELALPRLAAGDGVAAADAAPFYVRHRVALTAAEQAAGARL